MKQTILLIIGFVLFWNSGFIGADYGLPFTEPNTLMFFRYAGVALILFLFLFIRQRFYVPEWPALWRSMVIGGLAHGMWLLCVLIALNDGVPPGIVALVVGLQPLTTGAFSGLATGERTSLMGWIGLVLGFIGVALSVGFRIDFGDLSSIFSYFVLLVSVASITVASLMQRHIGLYTPRLELPVDISLFYQSIGTLVLVTLPAILAEGLYVELNVPFTLTISWLTIGVSIGAYAFMWLLLERINATRVASLFYLGPPVTMLMDWAAFGTVPNMMDFVGLAVIFTGVFVTYLPLLLKKSPRLYTQPTAELQT